VEAVRWQGDEVGVRGVLRDWGKSLLAGAPSGSGAGRPNVLGGRESILSRGIGGGREGRAGWQGAVRRRKALRSGGPGTGWLAEPIAGLVAAPIGPLPHRAQPGFACRTNLLLDEAAAGRGQVCQGQEPVLGAGRCRVMHRVRK
jgi:hypothetical protein